jgi:hypothetical protein
MDTIAVLCITMQDLLPQQHRTYQDRLANVHLFLEHEQ